MELKVELPEEKVLEALRLKWLDVAVQFLQREEFRAEVTTPIANACKAANAGLREALEAMLSGEEFRAEVLAVVRAGLLEAVRQRAKNYVVRLPDAQLKALLIDLPKGEPHG